MNILASDDFNRTDQNPITGKWSSGPSSWDDLQILSNAVRGAFASGDCAALYNGVVWPNDQWSECVISTFTSSDGGPCVRMATATKSCYFLDLDQPTNNGRIFKCVNGVFNALSAGFSISVGPTDVWRIEAEGTTLRALKNGAVQETITGQSDLKDGSAGLFVFGNTTSFIVDNWAGGDFTVGRGMKGPFRVSPQQRF